MNPQSDETKREAPAFDFSAFPADTLFLDRRTLPGRAGSPLVGKVDEGSSSSPKPKKERRRRIDPTTFEKQYTEDEIEFMNAVQDFKTRSGKMFPSHGDVLNVALHLGYRKFVSIDEELDPVPIGELMTEDLSAH